jgi:hypothetical protein
MSEQQEAFIDALLTMARRDAERATANRDDNAARSVALWMAGEVERQGANPELPDAVGKRLRAEARELRDRVLSTGTGYAASA